MTTRKNSEGLNRLKQSVVAELGLTSSKMAENIGNSADFMNSSMYEFSGELGINPGAGANSFNSGNITTAAAGRFGGKIGGNMVKKMIEMAKNDL